MESGAKRLALFAFVSVLVTAVVLHGCSNGADRAESDSRTAVPPPLDTIVMAILGELDTLNPVTSKDVTTRNILRFLLNPTLLMENPARVELVPWMAAGMPAISNDGRRAIWTILPQATWQDGKPVTADDALFTWEMLKAKETGAGGHLAELGPVKEVKKLSTKVFEVVFEKTFPAAAKAWGTHFGLVPAHAGPSDPAEFAKVLRTVHCGPYRVASSKATELVMELIPGWWGAKLPRFRNRFCAKRLIKKTVSDAFQIKEQLLSGAIHLAPIPNFDLFKSMHGGRWDKDFERAHYHLPAWSYIGFNCSKPPFDDRRVRKAISYLVRRKRVNESYFGNLAEPVSGPWYYASPYADPSISPDPYDPEEAQKLLDEAGWKDTDGDGFRDKGGTRLSFTISRIAADYAWMDGPLAYLADDLEQSGIAVETERLDYTKGLVPKVQSGGHDAYMLIWRVDAIQPDLYNVFHSSQIEGAYNWQRFSHAELDRLITECRDAVDDGKRRAATRAIHKLVHEEQPMCFLFNGASMVVWSKRVKGVKVYPLGIREWDFNCDEEAK